MTCDFIAAWSYFGGKIFPAMHPCVVVCFAIFMSKKAFSEFLDSTHKNTPRTGLGMGLIYQKCSDFGQYNLVKIDIFL
jgi:hypothetical protein